ncbi:hypothetical protein BJV82DRAFT_86966 [Fennellomyces sp. T-0311]|nr:hypothetical protein BJV82DRAFT_86966 [Fennellomyces sp. T-0311]
MVRSEYKSAQGLMTRALCLYAPRTRATLQWRPAKPPTVNVIGIEEFPYPSSPSPLSLYGHLSYFLLIRKAKWHFFSLSQRRTPSILTQPIGPCAACPACMVSEISPEMNVQCLSGHNSQYLLEGSLPKITNGVDCFSEKTGRLAVPDRSEQPLLSISSNIQYVGQRRFPNRPFVALNGMQGHTLRLQLWPFALKTLAMAASLEKNKCFVALSPTARLCNDPNKADCLEQESEKAT